MVAAFARAMASGDGHRDDGQDDDEPEGSAIGQGGDLPYSKLRAQTGVPT